MRGVIGRRPEAAATIVVAIAVVAAMAAAVGGALAAIVGSGLVLATSARLLMLLDRDHDLLRKTVDRLTEELHRDVLTGAGNPRGFRAALDALSRVRGGAWILMADVDGLKRVNDREGHLAGDELLRRAAAVLTECASDRDDVFRVGGDEFALVIRTSELDAQRCAFRVLERMGSDPTGASFSIGLARWEDGEDPWAAVDHADRRLYVAKRAGGAKLVCRDPQESAPRLTSRVVRPSVGRMQ